MTQSYPAKSKSALPRSIAVEILWPTGARALYALLGAEFTPNDALALDVTICTDDIDGERFGDAIALSSDDVRVGLLPEYGDAVVVALSRHQDELQALGAGSLDFNCAAHGTIGSAWVVFQGLAAVLLALLTADQPVSDELVKDLIRTRLFWPQH